MFCSSLIFMFMLRLLTERFTESMRIMLRIIPEHIYNTIHATFLKFFTGGLKKKNISYDKFLSIYSDWKISLVEIASLFFESFLNKFAIVGYIIPKYKLYIQNFNCMRPCTRCMHRYVHIDSVSRNGVRFHVSKHRFSSISNNFLNTKILKNNLQRPFFKPCLNFRGEKHEKTT